ncbi:cobalamin-dependent protein [Candidatus Woesearchaeota archaeon]|nr:cobalamin-dependent protein [Candidatus Woesearchaeota archaeon]
MYDILFIHPPALISPRSGYSGFLDSETGYGNQFPSFPVGLLNLADQVDMAGYKTRILNLASFCKDKDIKIDLDRFFSRFRSRIFAISLHWSVHANSALKLASYLKRRYPDSVVVLGGLSATFFRQEIMARFGFVDGIILAECDHRIIDIVRYLLGERKAFPGNLMMGSRAGSGKAGITVPRSQAFNYSRYDLVVEKKDDFSARRANIPMIRGCTQDCVFCGGSKDSYASNFCRRSVSHPDIKDIVSQFRALKGIGRDYIFLYGDLRLLPRKALDSFFSELKNERLDVVLRGELFFPMDSGFLSMWKRSGIDVGFSMSPETADESLRMRLGRNYTNAQIEKQLHLLARNQVHQSYFFMSPLPFQDLGGVRDSLRMMSRLYSMSRKYKDDFVGNPVYATMCYLMLIDPGSVLFRDPEKFGVKINFSTLSKISLAIRKSRHWSDLIGFETDFFSRKDIAGMIYFASMEKLRIHARFNEMSEDDIRRKKKGLKSDFEFFSRHVKSKLESD